MKAIVTVILTIVCSMALLYGKAQEVVGWKYSAKKIGEKTYEVRLRATIEEPWHIYSQSTPKGGPLPTSIVFSKNALVVMEGKVKEEGDMEVYHDRTFDVDVYAYGGEVDFVQVVKLKGKGKTKLSGVIEFMACTRERCLTPQKQSFSVVLE